MHVDSNDTDTTLQALHRIEAIVRETLDTHDRRAKPSASPSIVNAKAAYAARRQRNKAFGDMDELFEEPGWDMLLDLFIASHEGRRVCVSNACIAACVPHSTALRYVTVLERHGLIARVQDPRDRRRMFLELTSRAKESMANALKDRPVATGTTSSAGANGAHLQLDEQRFPRISDVNGVSRMHA